MTVERNPDNCRENWGFVPFHLEGDLDLYIY